MNKQAFDFLTVFAITVSEKVKPIPSNRALVRGWLVCHCRMVIFFRCVPWSIPARSGGSIGGLCSGLGIETFSLLGPSPLPGVADSTIRRSGEWFEHGDFTVVCKERAIVLQLVDRIGLTSAVASLTLQDPYQLKLSSVILCLSFINLFCKFPLYILKHKLHFRFVLNGSLSLRWKISRLMVPKIPLQTMLRVLSCLMKTQG